MELKNDFIEEPRLDSVVVWLSNVDGVESIKQDINKLSSTIYFLDEARLAPFHQRIKQIEQQDKQQYDMLLQNLMQLYPLSKPIVLEIVKESVYGSAHEGAREAYAILKAYDLGDKLAMEWNKLLDSLKERSAGIRPLVQGYEDRIQQYELDKKQRNKDIDDLEKVESKEKALVEEVKRLNQEYEALKRSYTKEALEELEVKVETKRNEKRKMQEQFDKSMRQIKEIEEDLKKVRSENSAYIRSLKVLSEIAKTLPDSEGD